MRESVIWGAIVGVALGVMVTFALARGLLALPWQIEVPAEAPARPSMHEWQDVERPTHGRTESRPAQRADTLEPRRPARPGSGLASVAPSQRGLSRS